MYSLGRAEYGRLGLGEEAAEKSEPTIVSGIEPASGVTCGASVSFAVTKEGEKHLQISGKCQTTLQMQLFALKCLTLAVPTAGCAYAWGMGTNLQLGTGQEEDEWSPVKMNGKQLENCTVLMVSSGGQHTVLLVKDKQES